MKTLNLSGFKPADSLSISVSQNALTAGPVNVPAWGGGGPGGDISINVHRSKLHVAPSSVRFSVDLSHPLRHGWSNRRRRPMTRGCTI